MTSNKSQQYHPASSYNLHFSRLYFNRHFLIIYFYFRFEISIFQNPQLPNIKYIRSKEWWTSMFQNMRSQCYCYCHCKNEQKIIQKNCRKWHFFVWGGSTKCQSCDSLSHLSRAGVDRDCELEYICDYCKKIWRWSIFSVDFFTVFIFLNIFSILFGGSHVAYIYPVFPTFCEFCKF